MVAPASIDPVRHYRMPTPDAFARASARLRPIRQITSPVFFSTKANGEVVRGLSGLPPLQTGGQCSSQPPVLFIGNHQLSSLFDDLPLVVEEIHAQTGVLVRALAHPLAFESELIGSGHDSPSNSSNSPTGSHSSTSDTMAASTGNSFIDALLGRRGSGFGGFTPSQAEFGAVPVGPRNLYRLLARGEPTLLYPGGVREAFKSTKHGESYQLFWPAPETGNSDFVRIAARFGATIVPVAAVGAEESALMLLDADEKVRMPHFGRLAAKRAVAVPAGRRGERFVSPLTMPTIPNRYYFLFGQPLQTDWIDAADKEACASLYSTVRTELEQAIAYLLEMREADPWKSWCPRVAVEALYGWKKQMPTFELHGRERFMWSRNHDY